MTIGDRLTIAITAITTTRQQCYCFCKSKKKAVKSEREKNVLRKMLESMSVSSSQAAFYMWMCTFFHPYGHTYNVS